MMPGTDRPVRTSISPYTSPAQTEPHVSEQLAVHPSTIAGAQHGPALFCWQLAVSQLPSSEELEELKSRLGELGLLGSPKKQKPQDEEDLTEDERWKPWCGGETAQSPGKGTVGSGASV